MKKFFISIFIFSLFFSSIVIVQAQSTETTVTVNPKGQTTTETNKDGNTLTPYKPLAQLPGFSAIIAQGDFTLGSYVQNLVRIAIGIIGLLAVVMIVISGVQYMGSNIITEKESAKDHLTGAVFGLILAVSSVLILRTINPNITKLSIGDGEFKKGVNVSTGGINIAPELEIQYLKSTGSGTSVDTEGVTSASIELGKKTILKHCGDSADIHKYDQYMKSASALTGVACNELKATFVIESSCGKLGANSNNSFGAGGPFQQKADAVKTINGVFKTSYSASDRFNPAKSAEIAGYIKKLDSQKGCNGKPNSTVCDASKAAFRFASYNGGAKTNKEDNNPQCSGKTLWQCPLNNKPVVGYYTQTYPYVVAGTSVIMYFENSKTGC